MKQETRSILLRVALGFITVIAGNLLAVFRSDSEPTLAKIAAWMIIGGYAMIFMPHLPIRVSTREPAKKQIPFPGIPTLALILIFFVLAVGNYWFFVWAEKLHPDPVTHY